MIEPLGHITIDAGAKLVGVSRNTVARLCRSGKVRFVYVGWRMFVNQDALLAYYLPKPVEVSHG